MVCSGRATYTSFGAGSDRRYSTDCGVRDVSGSTRTAAPAVGSSATKAIQRL